MSLPRKIWVGCYAFVCSIIPRDDARLDGDDGVCIFNEGGHAIHLADDMAAAQQLETFFHELTHAINYTTSIADGVEEEIIAEQHGRLWAQVLLDNPRLQRWITASLNQIRRERATA